VAPLVSDRTLDVLLNHLRDQDLPTILVRLVDRSRTTALSDFLFFCTLQILFMCMYVCILQLPHWIRPLHRKGNLLVFCRLGRVIIFQCWMTFLALN